MRVRSIEGLLEAKETAAEWRKETARARQPLATAAHLRMKCENHGKLEHPIVAWRSILGRLFGWSSRAQTNS